MGLIDTVRCHAKVPGSELLGDGEFQTRDFGCRFERFTIDESGRLIHHLPTREWDGNFLKTVSIEDIVVPIHRDVRLFGPVDLDGGSNFYARFTDGILQWVMPWEELTEEQREYAVVVES